MKTAFKIAYEKAITKRVNKKDCKECNLFSIKDKKILCNFSDINESEDCILIQLDLNKIP